MVWLFRLVVCFAVLALLPLARPALALTPDQIALVVNSKSPAGVKLAEFYAKQRGIPDGRVIALDLPVGEEMPYAQFDRDVVPAVRKFLKDNGLEQKVTCLVTFYGVPLRIGRRPSTPALDEEVKQIGEELKQVVETIKQQTEALEAAAKELMPAFAPPGGVGDDPNRLTARADAAIRATLVALEKEKDAAVREKHFAALLERIAILQGNAELMQRLASPVLRPFVATPPTTQKVAEEREAVKALNEQLAGLTPRVNSDKDARDALRQVFRDKLGVLRHAMLLGELRTLLDSSETEAAFDSELAMLWWKDGYARHRWHLNPLYCRIVATLKQAGGRPVPGINPQRTLMVMRLDAPTEDQVHTLIETSLRVEKEGLKGQVILDARGKNGADGYSAYDKSIRSLNELLKAKTSLTVVLDDQEALIPKGTHKNVAIYCGWYSLRRYVAGMAFNRGAVGFHIASSELVALHNPNESGWVKNLIDDGVVGTLGPVAEPYLHSFPPADEFFPLLLSGKLTLAEVYWHTTPLVSWMNTCIGDPLYKPYAANPAIKAEDIPKPAGVVLER